MALAAQRLLHRVEQHLWILRAGDTDLAVEDEERHAADSGIPRLDIRAGDSLAVGVAGKVVRRRLAVEPGALGDAGVDEIERNGVAASRILGDARAGGDGRGDGAGPRRR